MSMLLGKKATDFQVEDDKYPEDPLLPNGIHNARIVDITEGERDNGELWMKIVFELEGGNFHGQKVADFLGWGGSDVRENISNKKLKSLFTLCGVPGELAEYSQLYHIPIGINNKLYTKDGVTKNTFNFYRRPAAQSPTAAAPTPQGIAAPANPIPAPQSQPAPQPAPAPAPQPAPAPAPQPAPAPAPQPAPPPPPPQPVMAAPTAPPAQSIPTMPPGVAPPAHPQQPAQPIQQVVDQNGEVPPPF